MGVKERTNILEKFGASLINAIIAFLLSIPFYFIFGAGLTWKISVVSIFFIYNLYFYFFNKNRCIGMMIMNTHWEERYNKYQETIYLILYTISFSTIFFSLKFPFDILLYNLILQTIFIFTTGTTVHGYLSGKIHSVRVKSYSHTSFFKKFIKYSSVSLTSLIVDFAIIILLTEFLEFYYLYSIAIGFLIAILINYYFGRRWVFVKTKVNIFRGYFVCIFIGLVSFFSVLGLTFLFVEAFEMYYLIARLIVAVIVGFVSYILDSRFTFQTHYA